MFKLGIYTNGDYEVLGMIFSGYIIGFIIKTNNNNYSKWKIIKTTIYPTLEHERMKVSTFHTRRDWRILVSTWFSMEQINTIKKVLETK